MKLGIQPISIIFPGGKNEILGSFKKKESI
jgi:hypothetical protein